jgi:phosphotransferase system enzyme I (PtsI)
LEQFKNLPAVTLDGKNITLDANIETPDEISSVLANGAEGIGLYRSEFMYMATKNMPTEQDHYQNYAKIAKQMGSKKVIIRTIDLGGDKLTKLGLMNIGREENPFMGLRAIRLCLKYPLILKTQLKGILRASVHGNLQIMYPMISKIEEIRQANIILEQAKQELKKEGKNFNSDIKVGAMIEVPSIAVIADLVAKEVDFMSIGTNDLIQYTIAVDRVNEDVASLYEPLHPSILRLIKIIIDAGHKYGKSVGMCGEMASSIEYAKVLVGLGLDEFSMSSSKILKMKKEIRELSFENSKKLADNLLKCSVTKEIYDTIEKFNG